jgi:cytochrome c556
LLLGFSLVMASAFQASSAPDPVAARQAAMKQFGQILKEGGGYASGQTPFDSAKVKAVMSGAAKNAKTLKGLFPAGSVSLKSSATPAIWENRADFDKRLTQLEALATAAGAAKSAEAFKPAFAQVSGACKSCHDVYRKKPGA